MGTYGVTHVKKDEKIIPLSDSYDGYFDAMGLANIWAIKYMDDTLLAALADAYTAHLEENDGTSPDSRQIEQAIYDFAEYTKDKDALEWFKNALEQDVRTSVTGVGPLLMLNITPHYGRDFDYSNYALDLNKRTYTIQNYEVAFDTLRALSKEKIRFLGEYEQVLIPVKDKLGFDGLLSEFNEDPEKQKKMMDSFLEKLIKLDNKKVVSYFAKKDAQAAQELATHQHQHNHQFDEENIDKTESEDNNSKERYMNSYSVQTANHLASPDFRFVLTLCHRLAKADAAATCLLKNAMWGVQEDFSAGGISFYSPREKDKAQNHYYENVLNYLSYGLNYRFNIMSTAGAGWKYANELTQDGKQAKENMSLFAEPVIENCLYTLQDIQANDELTQALKKAHVWFVYHANYDELRSTLLAPQTLENNTFAFVWLYMSLLNQDKEVFEVCVKQIQALWPGLNQADQKHIASTILRSLIDGEKMTQAIEQLVMAGVKVENNSVEFLDTVKASPLLDLLEPYMTSAEKFRLLGKKKIKP